MKQFLSPVVFVGTSLLVALGLALGSLGLIVLLGLNAVQHTGPWKYNLLVGSTSANPYIRAQVAIIGLLALNPSEALYLLASEDSAGERLKGSCTYRFEGRPFAARWWSLTAYDSNSFLMENDQNRYSYNSFTVDFHPDHTFTLFVSRAAHDGNWIPLGQATHFDLLLRLYNPDPSVFTNFETLPWPTLVKESCDDQMA